jgi:hypothetical protein
VGGGVADDAQGGGIVFFEEFEGDVFVERGGEVDDAVEALSEYMASSDCSSAASLVPAAGVERGLMRATTTAAARRGEMLLAMSKGVVPAGTSRMEPSGSWIFIWLLISCKDSALGEGNASFRYNGRGPWRQVGGGERRR